MVEMSSDQVLSFAKVRDVKSPTRANEYDAGIDMYIPNDWNNSDCYTLDVNESVLIPSGIHFMIPHGYALIAFNKSGIATKMNLLVGACVIDETYQGEVHIDVHNVGNMKQQLTPGMKIIQLILLPINYAKLNEINSLNELYLIKTTRGIGGFGSTGSN